MKLKKLRKHKQFKSKIPFCPQCDDGTKMQYYRKHLKSFWTERIEPFWGWHCPVCEETIFVGKTLKQREQNTVSFSTGWH